MTSQNASLADLLAGTSAPPAQQRRKCQFGRLLAEVDASVAETLVERSEDRRWSDAALARVLRQAGRQLDGQAIGRHRRGECSCKIIDDWIKA